MSWFALLPLPRCCRTVIAAMRLRTCPESGVAHRDRFCSGLDRLERYMSDVKIRRATDDHHVLPVIAELEQKMEAVRERAFDLFSLRGGGQGHDLDDWVTAERELLGWSTAALKEHPTEFEVDVALPGFRADDVELTAMPHELIVHAARKDERSGQSDHVVWSEFGSSEVYRRVALPADVQTDAVIAQLKNGVLRVHAPKSVVTNERAADAEC